MSTQIRVMIVDDHEVVRRGIVDLVRSAPDLDVCAEAGTVAQAVRRLPAIRADVVLVDLQLPDGTGIDVLKALPAEAKGLVLTSFDEPDAREASLAAGARGFLLKSSDGNNILRAIRTVQSGGTLWPVKPERQDDFGLSHAEQRIVEAMSSGASNREIADQLGLSEKTIKNHVTSILAKTGLRRRTQVVAWAISRRTSSWQ